MLGRFPLPGWKFIPFGFGATRVAIERMPLRNSAFPVN